jgi:hypothetical protein
MVNDRSLYSFFFTHRMMKDNIHTLFLLELAVVVLVERRCENNNLSRMFVCVSRDMLRSYYRRERWRIQFISIFHLLSITLLLHPTATTTITRLYCVLDSARTFTHIHIYIYIHIQNYKTCIMMVIHKTE